MAIARKVQQRAEDFEGIPKNSAVHGRTQSTVPTTFPSADSGRQPVKVRRKPGRQPMPRRNYVGTIRLADGSIAQCKVVARGYAEAERKLLTMEIVGLEPEPPTIDRQ